ncbi:hypothetical protein [Pseudomonas sp. HMWF006]|uniref:hypothetical protein n=1 Tax=Pseudomonas sp. HMWF006 TaxID=2056843 RepID=UPI000D401977|nr:hypothetical protein [Pseudomonas sp. HMWF006]PTT00363.1 hypothetical protein DBR24_10790 [Pseudomonas sp. HMWF006]PTT62599.1 hypothetical protein DBR26_24280 [Pseudomonas sp. HMWF007]PTT94608.1 hypothetical protein DBR29_03020 [Pseudomonas sp. HMWF005]
MPASYPPEWFQMADVRRRRLSAAIWIPLRQSEVIHKGGADRELGAFEESLCVGSLAVYADQREIGETLGWSSIGLMHTPGPYAFCDGRYKPADQYLHEDEEPPVGVELVLLNHFNSDHDTEWLINQDLLLALRLMQEGDSWVSPNEGYMEVIRQRRNEDGRVIAIEIRAEHLRDYLCARGLALRLAQYRERKQYLADASHIPWHGAPVEERKGNELFRLHTFSIRADGGLLGRMSIMRVWRTDVDSEEDVPAFEAENNSNTDYEHYEVEHSGLTYQQVDGRLWREEWVEPAAKSERVRGDRPEEELYYTTGAAGEKLPASALNDEDIGLYLWFKADVIANLLAIKGSALEWYTSDTGSVKCSPDYDIHFGVNEQNHINAHAYDVVKLPLWQQKIWHGFNISPDGRPSRELVASQFQSDPADTIAPEAMFKMVIVKLNSLFSEHFEAPLFKPHDHSADILRNCHRFRALDKNGVLALAKDISRLTVDSIDIELLKQTVYVDPKEKLGSLKLLERLLLKYCDKDAARQMMTPLHIAYGLRLGDAHLPSKTDLEDALRDLNIADDTHPITIGATLLGRVGISLIEIGNTIHTGLKAANSPLREPIP